MRYDERSAETQVHVNGPKRSRMGKKTMSCICFLRQMDTSVK